MKRSRSPKPRRSPQRSRVQAPAKTAPPAAPLLVRIEKPVYGGSFLARHEGKAVFVPLALPGEQARVRITESRKGYAAAEVEEIVEPAPERIAPACPHFGACGGCHYQHTGYQYQLAMKQAILRETLERAGVVWGGEIAVLAGEPWAYRNRIRLAFDAAGRPGYRGRRSHAVVPIAECPIAAPLLVRAAGEFAAVAGEALRPAELTLFCDRDETALLATVEAGNPRPRIEPLAEALRERLPQLQGLEVTAAMAGTAPPRVLARWGAERLAHRAAGFDYRVDHGAFFQVNRWLVDALVERVTGDQSGRLAWDLFAGVGLFARALASRFERVVAVESSPAALPGLRENLLGAGGDAVQAETLAFLRRGRMGDRAELIVVDPPRAGLGPELCALLGEAAAPRMVYVSCDPATLARDLKALLALGYGTESVTLADLFPQTYHLETVVQLRLS
ncbi:MAG: 23S rRNA (uracil(1939)-C(5))-methyltransferase RlmD [Terracidiphilus sp.]